MKILIACEFSGVVREAFRGRGYDAWSCDILPSEDNSKFHIQDDIFNLYLDKRDWDMMIAHPPCTYISNMSNCRIKEPGRAQLRKESMEFFMKLVNCNIPKIAVENPRGLPEREYRKADQIIQPYYFGHPVSKQTCLWLKNLPLLKHTNVIEPERKWDGKRWRTWVDTCKSHKGKYRSVTFQGIADAMASQWV
jgi:hypothetical protein